MPTGRLSASSPWTTKHAAVALDKFGDEMNLAWWGSSAARGSLQEIPAHEIIAQPVQPSFGGRGQGVFIQAAYFT